MKDKTFVVALVLLAFINGVLSFFEYSIFFSHCLYWLLVMAYWIDKEVEKDG